MLEYYYRGVASWNWYYPYHYAPMASDLTDLAPIPVAFTYGAPFRPYEQLLAVQPSSSCRLLPAPYQVGAGVHRRRWGCRRRWGVSCWDHWHRPCIAQFQPFFDGALPGARAGSAGSRE